MIDAFFDYWLPVFVHEMRRDTKYRELCQKEMTPAQAKKEALSYADSKYQEVSSKDGISAPLDKVGLDKYENTGAYSDMHIGHQQATKGQNFIEKVADAVDRRRN